MADHNQISQQINTLEKLTRELREGYLPRKANGLIVDILNNLESASDALVKNDRRSLILLQRLQRAVGDLIVKVPNWLFCHGMLEKSVKMSPDPTQLGEAVKIGLFSMMLGRAADAEHRKLVALGMEAVRLGGMVDSGLRIIDNGYGLAKDQSAGFVPWRANAAERKMGAVANDLLTGLLKNTLEYSYTVEPRTLDNNLREIVGGLMYFGGESGCRSALELLPYAVDLLSPAANSQGEGEQPISVEDKVSQVLVRAYETSMSSNVLYALREHSYSAYLGHFDDFTVKYRIGEAIKSDFADFDIAVLPPESEEARKLVVETVNLVFCSDFDVNQERASRLLKMLKHFGLRGEELRLAITNSHVSSIHQWVLDLCLSGGQPEDLARVKPRDIVTQIVEFGANASALYEEAMDTHVKSLEGRIEFFKDAGSAVTRNGLMAGKVLKDLRVDPILSDPEAMAYISGCVFYHYGSDVKVSLGIERNTFTEIEISGLAGYIYRHMEKEDSKIWSIRLEDGLADTLKRCSEHPVTRAAIGSLPPDSVGHFKTIFKDWFTPEYRKGIVWDDHRFKAARLENELGM